MPTYAFTDRVEDLRKRLARGDADPRDLHQIAMGLRAECRADGVAVPRRLHLAIDEIEAAVVEDFYDNMPL